jgi:hypothetical protein
MEKSIYGVPQTGLYYKPYDWKSEFFGNINIYIYIYIPYRNSSKHSYVKEF